MSVDPPSVEVSLSSWYRVTSPLSSSLQCGFGPNYKYSLLVSQSAQLSITNRGSDILLALSSLPHVLHTGGPLLRTVVDAVRDHGKVYGDGAKSFLFLLDEILQTVVAEGRDRQHESVRAEFLLSLRTLKLNVLPPALEAVGREASMAFSCGYHIEDTKSGFMEDCTSEGPTGDNGSGGDSRVKDRVSAVRSSVGELNEVDKEREHRAGVCETCRMYQNCVQGLILGCLMSRVSETEAHFLADLITEYLLPAYISSTKFKVQSSNPSTVGRRETIDARKRTGGDGIEECRASREISLLSEAVEFVLDHYSSLVIQRSDGPLSSSRIEQVFYLSKGFSASARTGWKEEELEERSLCLSPVRLVLLCGTIEDPGMELSGEGGADVTLSLSSYSGGSPVCTPSMLRAGRFLEACACAGVNLLVCSGVCREREVAACARKGIRVVSGLDSKEWETLHRVLTLNTASAQPATAPLSKCTHSESTDADVDQSSRIKYMLGNHEGVSSCMFTAEKAEQLNVGGQAHIRLWWTDVSSPLIHLVTSPHDPMTSPHDPMTSPLDPMTSPHDPMTSPHDPMTSPHDPMTSPPDPLTSPSDHMTSPLDPLTSPSDPMTSPSDHVTSTLDHTPSPLDPMTSPSDHTTSMCGPCPSTACPASMANHPVSDTFSSTHIAYRSLLISSPTPALSHSAWEAVNESLRVLRSSLHSPPSSRGPPTPLPLLVYPCGGAFESALSAAIQSHYQRDGLSYRSNMAAVALCRALEAIPQVLHGNALSSQKPRWVEVGLALTQFYRDQYKDVKPVGQSKQWNSCCAADEWVGCQKYSISGQSAGPDGLAKKGIPLTDDTSSSSGGVGVKVNEPVVEVNKPVSRSARPQYGHMRHGFLYVNHVTGKADHFQSLSSNHPLESVAVKQAAIEAVLSTVEIMAKLDRVVAASSSGKKEGKHLI